MLLLSLLHKYNNAIIPLVFARGWFLPASDLEYSIGYQPSKMKTNMNIATTRTYATIACAVCAASILAAPVTVTLDPDASPGTSKLTLGITHTHKSLEQWNANSQAVERAKAKISELGLPQNIPIMGWGSGIPEPEPGRYDWKSLDGRTAFLKTINGEPVITLCTAPGWMKRGGQDWEMEKRVLPEHYDAFAKLAVEIAKRYPHVRHFIVWNEFKGFWSVEDRNWDAPAYTEFYNRVYSALKAHDPDLKIGGFYLVISGTGSQEMGKTGGATHTPISDRDRGLLKYWLEHKAGADFVCIDRGGKDWHDKNSYTIPEIFSLTHHFGDVARQVAEMTDLPIWYAEYYAGMPKVDDGSLRQTQAAMYASIYRSMVLGGVAKAFIWNPIEGEVQHGLFDNIITPEGGQPMPHYYVFKSFAENFGEGVKLVGATSSSPSVEAIASDKCVILINTTPDPVTASLEGAEIQLGGYEVKTISRSSTTPPKPAE